MRCLLVLVIVGRGEIWYGVNLVWRHKVGRGVMLDKSQARWYRLCAECCDEVMFQFAHANGVGTDQSDLNYASNPRVSPIRSPITPINARLISAVR